MYFYYFFAIISIWFGIRSLQNGFRYLAYVRKETGKHLPQFHPYVAVIAPSRGNEEGLADNVRPLLHQDYPRYEVLFVFDSLSDSAAEVISRVQEEATASNNVLSRTVIAGAAVDSGQKVHNLRVAVEQVSANVEVLVFVDTDARPENNWLQKLVAPLGDETMGASSGYRWFVPERGGLFSRLRSVWNASIASALGADVNRNFCWGGSTAIRRSTFEKLKIRARWQGSVSDDFTLTEVLHEARLPVHFNANCLVPSVGDCSLHELLEFTTRQIKITRVYAPHLWKPLLLGGFLFALVFYGGILLLFLRIATGQSIFVLASVLAIVFLLGAAKSLVRWLAVSIPLKRYKRQLRRDLLAQIFLWPVASILYLYNTVVAGFSQRIEWRGIVYQLKSPSEAVIISREN